MTVNLESAIKDGTVDFWEYSVRKDTHNSQDIIETIRQIQETKVWYGFKQGIHYYGIRFDGDVFLYVLSSGKNQKHTKFIIIPKERIYL